MYSFSACVCMCLYEITLKQEVPLVLDRRCFWTLRNFKNYDFVGYKRMSTFKTYLDEDGHA